MERELLDRLLSYVAEHNPELAVMLSPKVSMLDFLNGKVQLVQPYAAKLEQQGKPMDEILTSCLHVMTAELRPSKYQYVLSLLNSDFPENYAQMESAGVLKAEIIHLVCTGAGIFRNFCFAEETKNSSLLRHAIIHHIHQHLE